MLDFAVIDVFHKEAARRKRDLSETKQQDLELWEKWKAKGEKPNDLRPLLNNFRGLIRSRANRWTGVDLPPAAIHAEFTKQFVNALRTYDPNKGTALGSWVTTNLKKAQRWVTTYQNPARIQENRHYKVGLYQNAQATLDDQLGREPSSMELAEHLGWPEAEVGRMQLEIRQALTSSGFEIGLDPTAIMPSRDLEKLTLLRYELTPDELQVYDYTFGMYGKQQLRPNQIAKKLKMNASKVTRIRNSIIAKFKKYGG